MFGFLLRKFFLHACPHPQPHRPRNPLWFWLLDTRTYPNLLIIGRLGNVFSLIQSRDLLFPRSQFFVRACLHTQPRRRHHLGVFTRHHLRRNIIVPANSPSSPYQNLVGFSTIAHTLLFQFHCFF